MRFLMLGQASGRDSVPASSSGRSTRISHGPGLEAIPVPEIEDRDWARVEELTAALKAERPELAVDQSYRSLVAHEWRDVPALHLDDQSDISVAGSTEDSSYLQDRARIRASDGDIVACNRPPVEGYEEYCDEHLGLGRVEWVSPGTERSRRNLAGHCSTNRSVRRRVIQAIKSEGLRYIHPLMGSGAVWQLGLLLRRSSRRPIKVIAPPPQLARFANDKTEFTKLVTRLFGEYSLPMSRTATSLARILGYVRELSEAYARLGLKLPDSAGGAGNLVLSTMPLQGLSLHELRKRLSPLLRGIGWQSGDRILVSGWESHVLSAPSIQTWIPPGKEQAPLVEGVFEQRLAGASYEFVGTRPACFPASIHERIVGRGQLLASLFQLLGYIGRCSFDLVLIGDALEKSRVVFIECNGRWGGTSYPMTLMHRLFAGSEVPHYIVRSFASPGIHELPFRALLQHFESELFDVRTGRGWLVFFNPGRMRARSGITYIALGDAPERALHRAEVEVPKSVQRLLRFRRNRSVVRLP